MNRNVVVTGLGVVVPNAVGRAAFALALRQGVSGIDDIRSFDTSGYAVHRGGEVKGVIDGANGRAVGRTTTMFSMAASEAMVDAALTGAGVDPERVGVLVGTTSGEVQDMETIDEAWTTGSRAAFATWAYAGFCSNSIAARAAATLGVRGPALVLANACASGNYAVAFACDLIRHGHADAVVAGGADGLSKVALAGFSRVHAVAPDICQPFDRNRKGMMVSEGAGVVILEDERHARARGARVYARVLGAGLACDAFHLTAPDPDGMAHAMRLAMADAGLTAADVGYISAHGTGTVLNDLAETTAVKAAFGEQAWQIPISSIKSMIGHTMGAASAVESVACCLVLSEQFLPPTINYVDPDPQCDLDYVPNVARAGRLDVVMNNSFAFGGNNACIILGRA